MARQSRRLDICVVAELDLADREERRDNPERTC